MAGYNYDNFSSEDYDFDQSTGPAPGEKAPDFEIETVSGERRKLLDFDGEFLVLEMGSLTCPLFQSRRGAMERLHPTNPRISSAVLYVREAHPGADIPQHRNLEEKRTCATRLSEEDGETRTIFIDNFDGDVHKAYGGMPNTLFIINKNGCVVFRAEWNNTVATRRAVEALLSDQAIVPKSYFRPGLPSVTLRTLKRAGQGSLADFLSSFPSMLWNNLIKRNLRVLFNRRPVLGRDTAC
ncbi:deiodinase-like protein [Ruegeria sp. EL01]|jgi:hypothetical protein|uniref:deiodinase-like protein n=1 Tax=Ruegeria sp. EL01 TaxID=2107578 RepID=UPI0013C525DB|nr:deiodinase-like protein [Ruegeria sp. EL01]